MNTHTFIAFVLTCLISMPFAASAQLSAPQEPLLFDTPEQEVRFEQLTRELRCLVCQNQNLADSDAPLAHDLRREVHEMLMAGQSNEEIKQFLVARYGDFVLYRPPVQNNTYILWLAPLVLLLAGALILRANVKKRTALLKTTEDHND